MSSKVEKLGKVPSKVLEDMESDAGAFEKAMARAEELSKLAKRAAEGSIKVSQEAIGRAEYVRKAAMETAFAAKMATQDGVHWVE